MEDVRGHVIRTLTSAGCLSAAEEAEELLRAVDEGIGTLDGWLARRQRGEPLAWITGSIGFCGLRLRVDPGVYVPRPHTELFARRASSLLPAGGVAVDLCTGSGAVAAVMQAARPDAHVLATDRDPVAVACARSNGVTAIPGDLDEPLPASLLGEVDVMTAVVPYVPTEEMHLLPRDVVAYEPVHALDGGPRGTAVLERVAVLSVRWLRPGGRLLLEIGGDQAGGMRAAMTAAGLSGIRVHRDAEGQDRAIEAIFDGRRPDGMLPASVARSESSVRELKKPGEVDKWSGSRHVVQVRPHVWNWIAPRLGGGRALEIGPGLRPTAPVATSTFVDASTHALRELAARGGRTVPAAEDLPFDDRSFDAVLAFEVVEHIEDDTGLLREIARVSRPGGLLVLSTPVHAAMWSPLDDACGHVRRDEPRILFGKVREAGFEVGGYTWAPAGSRRLTELRARVLRSNRRLSTALVQTLVFPAHAAYQRVFGQLRWRSPDARVPAEADDVMLWARLGEGGA